MMKIILLAVVIGAATAKALSGYPASIDDGFQRGVYPDPALPIRSLPYQGFPAQNFPSQRVPGQGFPINQGLPYQGFPNAGLPLQRFANQGLLGQRFGGQGFPGFPQVPIRNNPLPAQGYTGDQEAVVYRSNNDNYENGNFRYGFETSNRIQADAEGFIKNPGAFPDEQIQAITGSYSHFTPDGAFVSVTYTADENGYRPVTTITRPGDARFGVAGVAPASVRSGAVAGYQ